MDEKPAATPAKPVPVHKSDEALARLAQALRANLKRRKMPKD